MSKDSEQTIERGFAVPSKDHVYSISQVCALTSIPQSTLRHWEATLGDLMQPARQSGGARRYSQADVRILKEFSALTREQGYTNAGAREEISRRRLNYGDIETVEQALHEIQRATQAIAREAARLDEAREFLMQH